MKTRECLKVNDTWKEKGLWLNVTTPLLYNEAERRETLCVIYCILGFSKETFTLIAKINKIGRAYIGTI